MATFKIIRICYICEKMRNALQPLMLKKKENEKTSLEKIMVKVENKRVEMIWFGGVGNVVS